MPVELVGIPDGDPRGFAIHSLARDPEYNDALFLYTENIEEHEMYHSTGSVLRVFNRFGMHKNFPRSAGIPDTYFKVHRRSLERISAPLPQRHPAISSALREIVKLIEIHKFKRLVFRLRDHEFLLGREDINEALIAISEDRPLPSWTCMSDGDVCNLEPWWNEILIEQVIARPVRLSSHSVLN